MNEKAHDRLCPGRDCYYAGPDCRCSLIAQVRADERRRASGVARRPDAAQVKQAGAYISAA